LRILWRFIIANLLSALDSFGVFHIMQFARMNAVYEAEKGLKPKLATLFNGWSLLNASTRINNNSSGME
jgi:hypothetical protein